MNELIEYIYYTSKYNKRVMYLTEEEFERVNEIKFNNKHSDNPENRCSRCHKELEISCICNRSHPDSTSSSKYRVKPIGNPDLQMDKGNINYMSINTEYIKEVFE